jgi:Holliday junction resolvase RusA-like endonuclease
MGRTFLIRENLAKLNEHDNANRRNRFAGAKLKETMTGLVQASIMNLNEKPIDYPVLVGFIWYYSGRHDFDNVRFSCKYILDGMVKAGMLPNDNQAWVKGFLYDKFVKVEKGEDAVMVVTQQYENKLWKEEDYGEGNSL